MVKVTALLVSLFCATVVAQDFKVPADARQANWGKYGSCVHAVVVTDLRYLGYPKAADRWLRSHIGGENNAMLAKDCEAMGVKIEQVLDKNAVSFLETNCSKKLGCGVQITTPRQLHEIFLTHIDPYWITYIDPNVPENDLRMTTQEFLQRWTGWAFVIYGVQQ